MLGNHVAADLIDCETDLNDLDFVENILKQAVTISGATLIKSTHHLFVPQGLTILLLLAESHLSFHSAPEIDFVYVDFFTCGDKCKPGEGLDHIIKCLKPRKFMKHEVRRVRI